MTKVKVAIIDTGLDLHDKEICKFVKFDRNLQINKFEDEYKNIEDLNGHGTLCAKTILSICKDFEIYPIKVFDDYGKTSSLKLIEVLKKLLNSDIKIINISASAIDSPYGDELSFICKELHKEGKVIISSHSNNLNAKSSIPTRFKEVIGVKGIDYIYSDLDYIYNPKNEIQMYANSKDCFIKFKDNITHFGKNSRAAALTSGIVGKILTKDININFEELESNLIQGSLKFKPNLQLEKVQNYNSKEIEIVNKLVRIINKEFSQHSIDLKFLQEFSLFNNITNIGRHNCYEFLTKINKEFNIDIKYKEIFLHELQYLNILTERIYKKLYKNI